MPLTALQERVFHAIRTQRSPDSFVYGAIVIHFDENSPRYSRDIDLSHDLAQSVAASAEADVQALTSAGFSVSWLLRQPSFQRAEISLEGDSVVLEWVHDSAFRFFPVESDPLLGYRLHHFDAATNKMLALASRAEPRDLVDAMHLHRSYLSLGTLAWAAAGKDEGLNPIMILDLAERFAHYRQDDLDSLSLASPWDIVDLSSDWREALERSRSLIKSLPVSDIGCCYLDTQGNPVNPNPGLPEFDDLRRHFGSVGGAWPRIAD